MVSFGLSTYENRGYTPVVETVTLEDFDARLDYDVIKEPIVRSGITDKYFVVNTKTNEALGIVGRTFAPVRHSDFFLPIRRVWQDKLPHLLDDVRVINKISRRGAWALEEAIFPKAKGRIETDKQSTEIALRFLYWHGQDALTSSNSIVGAVDFSCINGQVSGDYDHLRKKNTTHFSMDDFIKEIGSLEERFAAHVAWCQRLARKQISELELDTLLDNIIPFEKPRSKMKDSAMNEISTRGWNMWSVYSAFTDYASHSERFALRNTANDNSEERMFRRNIDVSRWVSSPYFLAMAA